MMNDQWVVEIHIPGLAKFYCNTHNAPDELFRAVYFDTEDAGWDHIRKHLIKYATSPNYIVKPVTRDEAEGF